MVAAAPDESELDWGTWGPRWRSGWDDDGDEDTADESPDALEAGVQPFESREECFFGHELNHPDRDDESSEVLRPLASCASGVGGGNGSEVVWEPAGGGGEGRQTLASLIKCWVSACAYTMS